MPDPLSLASLFFGGASAAKQYAIQKKMYEFQLKVAEDKKREEAERVKKVSDVANIKEYQENLAEKLGVATQDLERLGLRGGREITDDAARKRAKVVEVYGRGRATDTRTTAIQNYEDRLERNLISAGGTEADIASRFSQPVESVEPETGGGYAAWGNLYNDAMGEAAGDIEKYSGERSSLMAAMGATRKGDELTYQMGRGMGLADTGEEAMGKAWETDVGTAKQTIREQERKARAKIGSAQASLDRGYNTGEPVFTEPNQSNPYGAISSIFSNLSNIKWS